MNRLLVVCLASVAFSTLGAAARAQGLDSAEVEAYPQALAMRPLVLGSGMMEARIGGGTRLGGEGFRTKADVLYAPISRLQLGLETDMDGSPDFQARDVAAFAEYSALSAFSLRFGLYWKAFQVPDPAGGTDLESTLGMRFSVPIKFMTNDAVSFVSMPSYSTDLTGDYGVDTLELPAGLQVQIVKQVALQVGTGLHIIDWEADNDHLQMPVRAAIGVSPVRLWDIFLEFRMTDITDEPGRDDRWVMAWLAGRM